MAYQPWQPGMIITAARLASISPTWQDWTPVWTTSTGASTPNFGNASVTARWAQSATTVWWRLEITFGTTTNFAGGGTADNWQFSAPVLAPSVIAKAGSGELVDNTSSIGSRLFCRVRMDTTGTFALETSTGRVDATALTSPAWGVADAVSPWVWAAGDIIRLSGMYEAAA